MNCCKNSAQAADSKKQEGQIEKQKGASMVEYALLLALIAVIALAAVRTLGNNVSLKFSTLASATS